MQGLSGRILSKTRLPAGEETSRTRSSPAERVSSPHALGQAARGLRDATGGSETPGSLLRGVPHCPGPAAPTRPRGPDCAPVRLPGAASPPLSGAHQPQRAGQPSLWTSSALEKKCGSGIAIRHLCGCGTRAAGELVGEGKRGGRS